MEEEFEGMVRHLQKSKISVRGLFLNADLGFDIVNFRRQCIRYEIFDNIYLNKRNGNEQENQFAIFDELLYKQRFAVERTNAWMDGFKAALVRFETKSTH